MMNLNSYNSIVLSLLDILVILIILILVNSYTLHPLMMNWILIMYVMFSALKISFLFNYSWYSYIFYLLMVGGLMVLFTYFTSLLNNQMSSYLFFTKKEMILKLLLGGVLVVEGIILGGDLFISMKGDESSFYYLLIENIMIVKKLGFMDYTIDVNLYFIIYLFFIMVCSVLICSKVSIPMRQLIN